jgi:hypothetical protein
MFTRILFTWWKSLMLGDAWHRDFCAQAIANTIPALQSRAELELKAKGEL